MLNLWQLPQSAMLGGMEYEIHTDFRDILEIFSYLNDPQLPEFIRWQVAMALFYEQQIPAEHQQQAMEYLAVFLGGGRQDENKPGPRLLDWQQDCDLIVADVNRVAAREIRAEPFIHWWTFLSWFHAIGEGQLSTVVSIRDKIRRGKKLENWERDFYRENKSRVDLKKRCTAEELEEKRRLNALLDGNSVEKMP